MPYCLQCKKSFDMEGDGEVLTVQRNIQRRLKATDESGNRLLGKMSTSSVPFVKTSCPSCGRAVTVPQKRSMAVPSSE